MSILKINNSKISKLLIEKDELVKSGRAISVAIEKLEEKIAKHDDKEKEYTGAVDPKELIEKGNILQKEIEVKISELEKIGNEIMTTKLAAIPEDVKKEHYAIRKEKETLERERNKTAMKVQKVKDKVVPLIRKTVAPMLQEYEDIEAVKEIKGTIIINVFDHLEEWKKKFKKK